MADERLIDVLRAAEAVQFGEFELSSGRTSNYYIDKYAFETDPECLDLIAKTFAEHVGNQTLAGVALGAVPLVVVTSVTTGNPYVIVRKEAKEYGTGNRIEGRLDDGDEVIVIEDIATSGASALAAVQALREAGAHVEQVLVVVDREEGARELLTEQGVDMVALLSATDLLNDADSDLHPSS